MHKSTRSYRLRMEVLAAVVCTGIVTASPTAFAAPPPPPPPPPNPNLRQVFLVRQDSSDCTNSNVPSGYSPQVGGTAWVVRNTNGTTSVKVALTASPNTTYHFFLKCVRQIGDVVTNDEGVGQGTFDFATSSTGNVFAFDSYPDGAPAGNKFQSVQVKF